MSQARQAGIVEESISRHCVPQQLASGDLATQKEEAMNYIHGVEQSYNGTECSLTPLPAQIPSALVPSPENRKGITQQNRTMEVERGPC